MAKTYSLNDLGVTIDDMIMLQASGYTFDETDGISEEQRNEILLEVYKLKQKKNKKSSVSQDVNIDSEIEAASAEEIKDMNYRLKKGERLSAKEVASAVANGSIVSKEMRTEIKNVIVDVASSEKMSAEDIVAVKYLLDELDGKHIDQNQNKHSVHEYRKQFDDNPQVLDDVAKKLETVQVSVEQNTEPKNIYSNRDIEDFLKQGEIYLLRPEEIQNREIIEQANPNYQSVHQDLFVEHVEMLEALIKDYAEGRVDIAPDAIENMGKLIDTYGKKYVRGTVDKNTLSYDFTQDACNAQQRLAYERTNVKLNRLDEVSKKASREEKYVAQYDGIIEDLVKDIAYAQGDVDRENAIAQFNEKMSRAMDEQGLSSEEYKDNVRGYLEGALKDNNNLFGYLGGEYNDAAQYLLDGNGKLKDDVAVYVVPVSNLENVSTKGDVNIEEVETQSDADIEVDGIYQTPLHSDNGNILNTEIPLNNTENEQEHRERSPHNLHEVQRLSLKSLEVLADMKIISKDDAKKHSDAIEGEDILAAQDSFVFEENAVEKVKDPKDYKSRLVDKLLTANDSDLLTPELTTFAYQTLSDNLKKAKDEKKQAIADKLDLVRQQMDRLESNFANDENLYLADVTNVADAYDGYMHMFNLRKEDLANQNKDLEKQKKSLDKEKDAEKIRSIDAKIQGNKDKVDGYTKSEEKMDEKIKPYDEKWNIPDDRNPKDTSITMIQRLKTTEKILSDIKYDEETLGADLLSDLSNFKFSDNQGNSVPQFVDPTKDENDPDRMSHVWKEGMIVAPNSQLETVLKLAGNDIVMENLGNKEKLNKDFVVTELKDKIPFKLFEMYNEDVTLKNMEHPEKFTTRAEHEFGEFEQKLHTGPLSISPEIYSKAVDRQVNQVEVYTNRLDSRLGKQNTAYIKAALFEQIKDIDRKSKNRGPSTKQLKRSSIRKSIIGAGVTLGVGYVAGRTLTNIVGSGGVGAVSNAVALGGAIAISSGIAAWQIYQKKKHAKAEGKKYGWKEFKKDRIFQAQLATSALAITSAAICCVNAPEMSGVAVKATMACIGGSMALGSMTRAVQVYKDNRLSGHGKIVSGFMGAVNGLAAVGGSMWGRHDAKEYDITLTQHQDGYDVTRGPDQKTYNDDHIAKVTDRNNTNSMYEYRGPGPHDINAYRNHNNYRNEDWFTPEQHEKAINALKDQMGKLGWKEGVGNEEVMLRKLAAFERLHRNAEYVIPSGENAGKNIMDVVGGDYRAVLKGLLNGELTPQGAKIIDNIQSVTGADGHSNLLPNLGKDLYSYNPHDTGIGTEHTEIKTPHMVNDELHTAGGMFGFGKFWNKIKNKLRPGAKLDKVVKSERPIDPPVPPVPPTPVPPRPIDPPVPPVPPTPVPPRPIDPPVPPEPKPQPKLVDNELMLEEYKIVYGISPNREEGKNKKYVDYCDRVEKERQSVAPDSTMNEFLLARRAKLDEVVKSHIPTLKNSDTKDVDRMKRDYDIRTHKDTRSGSMLVGDVRQSLMQSNLTNDNYNNAITLSHFTTYADMTMSGGDAYKHSRDIHLNPKLDRHYNKESSRVDVVDMNAVLLQGNDNSEKVSGRDFVDRSKEVQKAYIKRKSQQSK